MNAELVKVIKDATTEWASSDVVNDDFYNHIAAAITEHHTVLNQKYTCVVGPLWSNAKCTYVVAVEHDYMDATGENVTDECYQCGHKRKGEDNEK